MKIMNRKHQTFCVDTNQELRNALDTWNLVEEDVLRACVPYFIQEKAAEDLFTYTDVFQKAILSDLLPSEYNAAMCRFFIRVIEYRRDAAHYLKEYMINVLCEHLKMEYMKGQYYSYAMTKKVIVWLSILHLEAVVAELRYNIVYEDFNAAIVDTLTEVTSLCATVIMPHILDMLPVLSRVVKDAPDQLSRETLCYAIRRLCGSIQEYIVKGGSCKVQLMKAMSNMKTNISTWLPEVHAELQYSTKVALEFFTVPESSESQPTESVDDELRTIPHAELLEKYREQVAAKNKELEDTAKQRIEMKTLVTSLVYGRKITKHFLHFLLDALKNADPKAKLTAALFFNEALKHPRVMKQKYQESAIQHLLKIIEDDDNILCSIAMEALGNATTGATRLVERYKNKIIAHLELRLSKSSNTKIIRSALRALSSIIRRLKLSVLSRQFFKICRVYMDYPDGQVQIAAINLLRDLTESCRLPLFGYFTDKVRSFIPTLLLKLHSDNQEIVAASTSSLQSCLSYIKGANIRGYFRTDISPNINDLRSIYSCLAHNHPKLMKTLLLQTPSYLVNSEDKEAVVRHVEFLKDAINHDVMKDLDLYRLSLTLATLHCEGFSCNIRKATEKAVSILATKWFYIGSAKK
ncbi:uncharacterized protein LOC142743605 [Rhinoderma darwinii]|uniref:uncharacterized protein LOC142743605 n=1 Tax=Rhinoderma darwinii TaxID=43563 RepID=UPI003F680728